jgi:aryl-alcohol dehydrogenase-like predicted oxidoreductase
MKRRPFGSTPLSVSPLGFGAGQIGGTNITESEAGTILNRALDRGMNLVDTARGYGLAEERIGRHLSWRREEFILVSKCGYSVPSVEDWTPRAVREGVDMALRLMQTDYLDVMLFHSCPAATLQREGLIDALAECVEAGKVRHCGYSGENEDLAFAIGTGRFSVIETSVNIFDQRGLSSTVAEAAKRGMAVIAKRSLGNVAWKYDERPVGNYCEPYWMRMQAMNQMPNTGSNTGSNTGGGTRLSELVAASGLTWEQVALRFAAYAVGVSCAIVGTANIHNLERNIEITNEGALPAELVVALQTAFRTHDDHGDEWAGQV